MTRLPVSLHPESPMAAGDASAANSLNGGKKDVERGFQWDYEETKEFIAIRSELEKNFSQSKRNKPLWETISSQMREKGYRRSVEHCKRKWKSLVNRYKGTEMSELENPRQCLFFDELHGLLAKRAPSMDSLLLESEIGSKAKLKDPVKERPTDKLSEGNDSEEECLVKRKKFKAGREQQKATALKARANSMQEVLEDFFEQQQRIEAQWREAFERREHERRLRELEWRESMEKLERERILQEQAWREREEERRVKEESRAEKRDALFTALLSRLAREEL